MILIDCPAVKSSSHISAHCGECETWHIIAREERSGFQGALLATTHTYDIGNRETSSERGKNSVYAVNSLNQYTSVDDFIPQFDDDGNQSLVQTATIYYNYRHLELETGRWMSRDPITETEDRGLYVFVGNQVGHVLDSLGLAKLSLEYETSEGGKMTMSEIIEDFRKKFAKYSQDGDEPYNCLSHLRLIGHGAEGRISLGKHTISQYWIDSYLKRKANGERPPKDEPTEALDMLSLASSFACNDFTIEFVSCCSGRGDDGDYLKQSLRKLLGEKSNIILYEREVGKCFGFVIEKPYWLSWWESFGGGGKGQLKYARGKSK